MTSSKPCFVAATAAAQLGLLEVVLHQPQFAEVTGECLIAVVVDTRGVGGEEAAAVHLVGEVAVGVAHQKGGWRPLASSTAAKSASGPVAIARSRGDVLQRAIRN